MGELGPTELRLMQGLAQQVTALRPELLNGDATIGELAWVWAEDFDALNQFWRHRMWFAHGRLPAWGWVYLPYRVPRSDGRIREVKSANLIWQVHPDQPELLTEILDWYDDVAGDVDRLLTVQSADMAAQPSPARTVTRSTRRPVLTTVPGISSMCGSWPTCLIQYCRTVSGFWPPRTCRSRTPSRR